MKPCLKLVLSLITVLNFNYVFAMCPKANIPNNTRYDRVTFSWTINFRVKDESHGGEKVANIQRVTFNSLRKLLKKGELAGARFDYYVNGKTSFYGEQVIKKVKDAVINRVEVKDCNHNTIGYIVETIGNKLENVATEVLEEGIKILTEELFDTEINVNLSNLNSSYEILDAQGQKTAYSKSFKFIDESITILTLSEAHAFKMEMNGLNLDPGDDWYVNFESNQSEVDNRILALIPAFKSYSNSIEDAMDSFE